MIGAVDIGGTKIAVGLVEGRQVLARREVPTAAYLRYEDGLAAITSLLDELTSWAGDTLEGIGIGLTGRLDGATRRIGRNDFLKDWQKRDLTGDLGRALGLPVGIENDADAAALAEAAWGAGQGKARFIYITVSTGIGGGIVLDGRLYRGLAGSHPELGHQTIDPSGPLCFCGARGCWERLASGTAMLESARSIGASEPLPPDLDARQICNLAESGAAWARQVIDREGYYLGLGLANLVTLFAPDCIALGGGVMRRWGLFASSALRIIRENCRLVPAAQVEIVQASLGENTPLLGAAQAWNQMDK